MSVFSSELVVGFAPGDSMFVLRCPLIYWSGVKAGEGVEVVVPEGFVTDFASIPRLFWSIAPPYGWYAEAAVVHDLLYSLGGVYSGVRYTRYQCDRVLLTAMYSLARVKAKSRIELFEMQRESCIFYWVVRFFGWLYFHT
jgi:hypothetical protein